MEALFGGYPNGKLGILLFDLFSFRSTWPFPYFVQQVNWNFLLNLELLSNYWNFLSNLLILDSSNGPAAKKSKQNGIPSPTVTSTSSNQYHVTVPGLPAHLTQFAGHALGQTANLLTHLSYEINIRVDEQQLNGKLQNVIVDLNNQLIELRKAYETNKLGLEAANQNIQELKDLVASMSPIRPAPSPVRHVEEADPVASMSGNPEAPEEERPEPVQRATRRKQFRSFPGKTGVTRRKTGKETGGRQQRRLRSIEGKTKRARETNDEEDRILGFLEEARRQMSEEQGDADIIAVGTDDLVASLPGSPEDPEEEPPVQKVAPLKKQLLVFYPGTKEHHEYIRYRTDLYSQSLANESVYQFMPTNKHLYDCRDKACLPQPVERAPRLCEYEALFPPKTHTTKGWQAATNAEKLLEKLRVEQRRQLDANVIWIPGGEVVRDMTRDYEAAHLVVEEWVARQEQD